MDADNVSGLAPRWWWPFDWLPYPRGLPTFRPKRLAAQLLLAVSALYLTATIVRVYERKYYIFLPDYLRWTFSASTTPTDRPTHLFILMVDHFEPDWQVDVTERWAGRYVDMASRHRDADGRPPQHTWFYPGEQIEVGILKILRHLMELGLGEVELHYHHDYDSSHTMRQKLEWAIEDFQQFGFLKTIDGRTQFAFIHGNFGLDNARGPLYCGVNDEITILRKLGCFGEFSFPSVYLDSQPSTVNNIFAVKDDEAPKSYESRLPLAALTRGDADLMVFQGPLVFAPSLNIRRLFLDLDDGDIHPAKPASASRIRDWIRADVHVPERPDWIFIKLFAHGASSKEEVDEVVGPHYDDMLTALEQHYNDGRKYVLHYVTAREAYNVAMAAASGRTGQPRDFFDAPVPPYVASGRTPNRPVGN